MAYTSVGLDLHQDLLYYENPPGVQLLHCLRFDDEVVGGLSTFGDGLALAQELRTSDPEAHAWLREIELPYHYVADGHRMQSRRSIFGTDAGVLNWAWPWLAPLRLWSDEVEPVYRALHAWHQLCAREDRRSSLRLRPGEVLIFDNRRMLHGRTAFDHPGSEPARVLEGTYVDWDGVASRYRAVGG